MLNKQRDIGANHWAHSHWDIPAEEEVALYQKTIAMVQCEIQWWRKDPEVSVSTCARGGVRLEQRSASDEWPVFVNQVRPASCYYEESSVGARHAHLFTCCLYPRSCYHGRGKTSSCRRCGPQNPKYVLWGPLQKGFANPRLDKL